MFKKSPDERLTIWSNFRKELDNSNFPLKDTAEFWAMAPTIIHHNKIDPFNFKSWPTPWEIIVENKYDDFTIALMMGYTLKLSNRFRNEKIQVRTMVDYCKTKLYNVLVINDSEVLNYVTRDVVKITDIDESLYLENAIDIVFPR